jgi:hypothetical protein
MPIKKLVDFTSGGNFSTPKSQKMPEKKSIKLMSPDKPLYTKLIPGSE